AQAKHTNRFTGLFAGAIALITVASAGTGAQILLQASSGADRQVDSIHQREAGKTIASTETRGEFNGADAGQQSVSSREDLAAETLLQSLQSASWDARKAAVEKLAQIRGGRAVELLISSLKDEHVQVREQAVIGLGIREDDRLIEPLIAALTDR